MNKEILLQQIESCIKASEILEYGADRHMLSLLKDKTASRDFLLPFIGQFSAGKSKLINTLLGEDILPTDTNETTAILTYIKYAPSKYAEIVYADGERLVISIEEVAKYYASALGENAKEILRMNVFVDSTLLQTGLTIVDTPGLNSLIQKHIELTEKLLSESLYVVMVMHGQMSVIDLSIIEKFESLNIPVIFVRTHLDLVNLEEESFEEVEQQERSFIEKVLNKKVNFFAVTSEYSLNAKPQWAERLNRLKSHLTDNFISNIESLYLLSVASRVELIRQKLIAGLRDKIAEQKDNSSKSLDTLQKELSRLENIIKQLTEKLDDLYRRHEINTDNVISDCKGYIDVEVGVQTQRLKHKIAELDKTNINGLEEAVNKVIQNSLLEASAALNSIAEERINQTINRYHADVEADIEALSLSLESAGIRANIEFNFDIIAEYDDKIYELQQSAEDKLAKIQHLQLLNDEELNHLGVKRSELLSAMDQLSDATAKLNQALFEFDKRCPQRHVHVKSRLGEALSKVGNVCDWAMLVLPATAWTKASTVLATKSASLAQKSGKLAQAGSKLLGSAAQGMKVVAQTDTVKDVATIVQRVPLCLPGGNPDTGNRNLPALRPDGDNKLPAKKSPIKSVLEKFSLSYWFGEIGRLFDPDRIELDKEFEKQRQEAKSRMKDALQENMRSMAELRNKHEGIGNSTHDIDVAMRRLKFEEETIKKEYEHQQHLLCKKRDKELVAKISSESMLYFKECLEKYAEALKRRAANEMDRIMKAIMHTLDLTLIAELDEKKAAYEQAINDKKNSQNEAQSMINSYETALQSLEVKR